MTVREFTMDELGDPYAPVGSRPWALYISNEIRKTLYDKQQTGNRLVKLIEMFREKAGYQELGFLTWESFCESRLQIAAEKLETEARNRVAEIAANIEPLNANGGNRKHQFDNCQTDVREGGNSNDYLTARIARDNPEILEGMKQGKYRSVRAAAIDAGIIDPDKTRRHQLPTDPAAAGRYLAQRVDAEWMLECYDAFMKCREDHVQAQA